MSILRLDNVSYRYSGTPQNAYVFENLSYEFEQGLIYAINGKSGSGKTTLLSLLSGLEKCTKGDVYYEEKLLKKINLDEYRSNDIGIIFQSYNLLPHLTAGENIELSMDICGKKFKNKKAIAIELLEKVGLSEEHYARRVLKLSGGQQQRVAIARALSYDPKLILADEPTGNLDAQTEKEIIHIFKELAEKDNKCVIIVTHSQNVCKEADQIYNLDQPWQQ